MSSLQPVDKKTRNILLQIARTDGPARLFKPRAAAGGDGVLPSSKGPAARLVVRLMDHCIEELPRSDGQPRLLRLSEAGIRALVESTPAAQRPALARQVSSLYRDRLLRAWRKLASPSELADFQTCCRDLYADLLPPASDAYSFQRALAKELVLSWERTEELEARRGLVRAMLSLGLRTIGQAGERTQFTGRLHLSEEPLFQGDSVEIVEPGWTVTDRQGEFLIRKAQVKSVAAHAS